MILAYHVVSDDNPYLYSISRSRMEQHFQFLTELRPPLRGNQPVTFDDGHVSQYQFGLPLLEQYSLRGIFFVTPEWTDRKPGYMNWAQLRDIVSRGHEVQSHGWSHKFLTQCSAPELRTELRRSRQVLEDGLGVPINALAVPNGAWDRRVLLACEEAGYTRIYTSDPFLRPGKHALEMFGRVSVQRNTSPADLARFARAESTVFSGVRLRHHAKRAVRAALGQRLYHELWCRLARADARDNFDASYQNAPLRP